jgi:outer membrane murein-binding lipoprotein Lpp
MKQYFKFFALVLAVLVMASCNQQEKQLQQEVATLNEELEQLRQESLEKEENINMFFESMAQIRDNLTEIKVKQNMITEETLGQTSWGRMCASRLNPTWKPLVTLWKITAGGWPN